VTNHQGLKSRNLITLPLDIPEVEVISVEINEQGDHIVTVESMRNTAVCQSCGGRITKPNGYGREIGLRHLPILGHRLYIRLRPKRYECHHCHGKTSTQELDWYDPRSPHTKAYDRHLLLQLVNSTVEDVRRKEAVGYDAVAGAIERCIQASVNWDEFSELKIIGIDEIAMTKGHSNFVAILTTQQTDGHVALLGVLADRQKETVRQFLESIPSRLWQTMEKVCTDMWEGYANAVAEFDKAHPEVSIEVVVDRFHVAKNYRESVDHLRKQECRRLKKELSEAEYAQIQGVLWPIRKNSKDLTDEELKKLNRLFEYSPDLKLAYSFREELTSIFEMQLTKAEAKQQLLAWQDKISQSSLTCFGKFLTTLNNWLDKIINYFAGRFSSGFVEGLNNKIKTTKRRCYGILRNTTLFQRLYLDIEGYRRFA
jgi:transposase